MGSQRNTGAFVAGSVLGGMIGAAVALWKTPQTGSELRTSLSGGGRHDAVTYGTTETADRRFSNPVLGFVEKATAPIVGVELGKLAKDDPRSYTAPARASSADARPPETIGQPVDVSSGRTGVTEPIGTFERATDETFAAESPDDEVTHDPVEGSTAHAATTADLTSPTEEYVEELAEEKKHAQPGALGGFKFEEPPAGTDTR